MAHRTRQMLLDRIRSYPGISFTGLMKSLDLNEGTLRYHLQYLEKRKVVFTRKDGRRRLYFGYSDRMGQAKDDNNLSIEERRVLNAIRSDPGLSRSVLFERVPLPHARIAAIVRRLKVKHLVMEVENISGTGLEYVTPERLAREMLLELAERFLKGKIDRDSFLRIKELLENSD